MGANDGIRTRPLGTHFLVHSWKDDLTVGSPSYSALCSYGHEHKLGCRARILHQSNQPQDARCTDWAFSRAHAVCYNSQPHTRGIGTKQRELHPSNSWNRTWSHSALHRGQVSPAHSCNDDSQQAAHDRNEGDPHDGCCDRYPQFP